MTILEEIISAKEKRVANARVAVPFERLRENALARSAAPHALRRALARESGLNIIAEFKRRSPSKGIIRDHADPAGIARAYERGGAAAISVLTEQDYFGGSLDDLAEVRRTTALPLLRKDFIFDEYQVFETAAAGADALLLIVAALADDQLRALRVTTEEELGLDALVEVHSSAELQRAVATGARLIGVNNRDLRTFSVSLDTSMRIARAARTDVRLARAASAEGPRAASVEGQLATSLGSDVLLVSESGLNSRADLLMLQAAGFRGFLVGESLMRAEEAERALRSLLEEQI